jgi:hypothetical protein
MTTAKNRAIDQLRRRRMLEAGTLLGHEREGAGVECRSMEERAEDVVGDDLCA